MTIRSGLPQTYVDTAVRHAGRIRALVRLESDTLRTDCERVGMPAELAVLCSGLLASVIDDMVQIGNLQRSAFERTKRKLRILSAADEPAASALRLAIAASPLNGRSAVAHWDVICDQPEVGKLAWLLGVDTENAFTYSRRHRKAQEQRT